MARRRSDAGRILDFFRNSPIETAKFTLDLVKDIMKERARVREFVVTKERAAAAQKKAKGAAAAVPVPDASVED